MHVRVLVVNQRLNQNMRLLTWSDSLDYDTSKLVRAKVVEEVSRGKTLPILFSVLRTKFFPRESFLVYLLRRPFHPLDRCRYIKLFVEVYVPFLGKK